MTNEEAIKYLKQLYPYGGHCWLVEQRIEAIGMAIKALQEEPVSEDLEEAVNAYIGYAPEVDESSSIYGKRQAFKAGAKWQEQKDESKVLIEEQCRKLCDDAFELGKDAMKQQMMANAVDGRLYSTICGAEQNVVAYVGYGEYGKDGDQVKLIIIKAD